MDPIRQLVSLVARLRGPDGCPWDRKQTLRTMRPHLIEEAYEVLEAVDAGDDGSLEEELGDLLFNVLLLIRIAEDDGRTSLDRVSARIHDKMVRRHPHVFGDDRVDGPSLARWEAVKAAEKSAERSRLDGIPTTAPALMRAHRQGQKAAGVGFDWPDVSGVLDKVDEELAELREAIDGGDKAEVEWELGDLLLSLASLGRHTRTPAEDALRLAIARFDTRFRAMETAAREAGEALQALDSAELERMWGTAKRTTDAPGPDEESA